ncbi:hypothetical protein H6P81_012869 [Aristolochia fimbriata]|uniref:Uncharacterized protein n=1 Tax=Aristolochia fimbriata TaxID=158543 RepID=A0AAV7EFX5_ARIFI|nr:hypothetical protein H6P81_012869 [Aristolochia fimbriata]
MRRGYFPASYKNFGEQATSVEDTRGQQQLPAKTPGESPAAAKAQAVAETPRELERNFGGRMGHPKLGEARQGGQDYHSYLKSIARMPSVIDRAPNYSVFHTRAT